MSCPASGSSASRGSSDLDREHVVARRQRASARAQSLVPRGSRDDDDHERVAAGQPPDPAHAVRERGRRARRRARRPCRAPCAARPAPAARRAAGAAAARRAPQVSSAIRPRGARRAGRSPAPTPCATSDFSRSAVPNAIEAETSTQHPRGQRALGDVVAHVGDAGARGGGGVDPADVVAELVGADLGELGARAAAGRAALARAAARAARRASTRSSASTSAVCIGPGPCDPGGAASVVMRAAAPCGLVAQVRARTPPTVSRMRSSRSSALTPSPSAS